MTDTLGPPPIGLLTDGETAALRAWAEDFAAKARAEEREKARKETLSDWDRWERLLRALLGAKWGTPEYEKAASDAARHLCGE